MTHVFFQINKVFYSLVVKGTYRKGPGNVGVGVFVVHIFVAEWICTIYRHYDIFAG
ncbi:MAG: hypothetical protein STSR0009_11900 [Methanoregula sp.]